MKGILAGIFLGVFFGALGYEIINRTKPEMVKSIRRKVADGIDKAMGADNTIVDEYEDDLDDMDLDMEQEPGQA